MSDKKAAPAKKKTDIKVEAYTNITPAGEKKDINKDPFLDSYNPLAAEAAWYEWWEKCGYFKANNDPNDTRPKFVIMLPPPNVTGSLHLGHALTGSIQDSLSRWHRMIGDNVLYLPGIDHAGIATQVVVEKKLMAEQKVTRHDLGREKFVEKVWEWKDKYGSRIVHQLKKLGSSLDWSRECFTMDPNLSAAVKEAFVRLYDRGVIFRENRLVNWDCKLKTAISNLEVDHMELEAKKIQVPGHDDKKWYEFGYIWSFDYESEDDPNVRITISTTRPETMLGDVAVAVNSKDPRWQHLHGKYLRHPFVDRRMPIIIDDELVDPQFGTGAVKITPAHDPNDFACGKRHNLPQINIFTDDGKINENGGEHFKGLMRFDARVEVIKKLTERGLFKERTPHKLSLGVCSRSNDVIEPMIKPQWYMNCNEFAAKAVQLAKDNSLEILPEREQQTWYRWLDNIQDWCISRQLWWGHRIPAYFVTLYADETHTQKLVESDTSGDRFWVVGRDEQEALKNALTRFASELSQFGENASKHIKLEQDEDVLDTWFSSGLFPFSTLGWPNEQSPDFTKFFPNSLLETGSDILFFWVSRMVMMSLALTDKLPFTQVFLHAMVRDRDGRKMSKSLGNVIDPIDVMLGISLEDLHKQLESGNISAKEVERAKKLQREQFPDGIPQNGTDALRFTLLNASTKESRDINLDVMRVFYYRTFCNKIWNAVRFALMSLKDFTPTNFEEMSQPNLNQDFITFSDKWILSKLETTIRNATDALRNFEFSAYTNACYNFWLFEFCDVYIEASKPVMVVAENETQEQRQRRRESQLVLYTCIEQGLRLLHPAMPFITEELWQRLPGRLEHTPKERESIMINAWPTERGWKNEQVESDMELVQKCVYGIRNVKASYNLPNKQKPTVYVRGTDDSVLRKVMDNALDVKTLSFCGDIQQITGDAPSGCAAFVVNEFIVEYVDLTGLIDFKVEHDKQIKKRNEMQKILDALQNKMSKEGYAKVPDKVKNDDAEKLIKYKGEIESLEKNIADLKKLI